jgi:basic membrane lipoprotein Med (substrate-binding protein (PBP1-ABC) superfamily)
VVKSLVDGTFKGGGVYVATAANGGVGLAPYHDFDTLVPAELKAEVEAIQKGIIDGTIKTGWPVEAALPGVDLKVGMVSDVGGIDDASFNQNTWDGLQRAATELGVQAKFIESQAGLS